MPGDTTPLTEPYSFGFIDEYAKKELRRSALKAIAIPGYQVPYASRDMPIARGFGTGGLQLTLALIGPDDALKVIDQGSDESVNAVSIRSFIAKVCPDVTLTTHTPDATLIQTRHRIPEFALKAGQTLVLQVPYPDPLVVVEPHEARRRVMHGQADYAQLLVKLYEDIVQFSEITISHRYPTRVHSHYVIDPSPIPRFDIPKLHQSEGLYLFSAGREKKIYCVPPFTSAVPLAFEDVPFRSEDFRTAEGTRRACVRCGSRTSFLDEFVNSGGTTYQCSDTDYCDTQRRRRNDTG
ncbi:MAG: alpha-D-ribose 1-methylphosphonate 5-phosphate C-P-lyase PhnJ [Chloroflexales bacterium]|nr:alpha-D-ribose 1-methylphosphonate 5-phosphate C-P-lyase PhnJ [Chloroflexales bacterium]